MARILFVNKGKLGGPSYSLIKLLTVIRYQQDVRVLLTEQTEFAEILRSKGIPCECLAVRYRSIPGLYRMLKREKIELVYANSFSAAAWRVLIAAKLARCKFIWHIREVFKNYDPKAQRTFGRVRWADALIAVSEASAASIGKFAPKKKISVVYNGIDIEEFSLNHVQARLQVRKEFGLPENSLVIINVGAIGERKNQKEALEAAIEILVTHPNIFLFFIGDIEDSQYAAEMGRKAHEAGIEKQVLMTGFRKDTPSMLCGADILLHVPKWDPHPRAVLEAMGASLPVVAYAVDGVCETVVPEQTGYLVPFGDTNGINIALTKLTINPILRSQMGENGRARVTSLFTAENTASQISQIILQTLRSTSG